ncbi:protein STRUBBELIG-RECEPTOR FAMILY 8 [Herrania umbratica]|uniref:Protein STRUBBELIG-RECEPTOR FAMILY 8 n=1 Tax=Herrania umbratica TaxID=108875 RepID=A0A6J1B8Q7_9ROSI|nr:protein STRUBBELIG-RECEPTOR FAMILY 8 [Herrania umbratica]
MSRGEDIAYDLVLVLLSISLFILGIFLIIICRKKPVKSDPKQELPVKVCASAYQLTDIDAATDGFNHRRIIGKGRLGTVYAAISPRAELVAVKRIHPRLVLSNAGFGFASIIRTLSLAQHPHIVPIIGFAQAPGERIIVMEFVGMVNLDFYLHENSDGASLLDWNRRLRVAAGVARGLEYLHEGMAPNIIHGCIKASNILLDVKFVAKLCGYGLSFLAPQEKKGLVGYVDDEYWVERGGGACKESDVYGFGVVLLELLTGRRSEEGLLVRWALPLIKDKKLSELLDPRLVIPSDIKPLVRLAKVASACVGNYRKDRPCISQVATILNNLEVEACH